MVVALPLPLLLVPVLVLVSLLEVVPLLVHQLLHMLQQPLRIQLQDLLSQKDLQMLQYLQLQQLQLMQLQMTKLLDLNHVLLLLPQMLVLVLDEVVVALESSTLLLILQLMLLPQMLVLVIDEVAAMENMEHFHPLQLMLYEVVVVVLVALEGITLPLQPMLVQPSLEKSTLLHLLQPMNQEHSNLLLHTGHICFHIHSC